jgi:phosphate transport system permease protein
MKFFLREAHWGDRIFLLTLRVFAWAALALVAGILLQLVDQSWPLLKETGWGFFTTQDWDPVAGSYGALSFAYGTAVTSALALMISLPISLAVAVFLTELAPLPIAWGVGFLVEMLAAIPSVVYGLWGIFVLSPWIRLKLAPFLSETLGFLPFFQGPSYGVGLLTAGLLLAIMITPTIASLCREVFRSVPTQQREAALALGATRWEAIRLAVLKSSTSGIFGAVALGLGRALGETMAVTMVIGNRPEISLSLFAPAQTLASVIANEFGEATDSLHMAALASMGLALFLISFSIHSFARVWMARMSAASRARKFK